MSGFERATSLRTAGRATAAAGPAAMPEIQQPPVGQADTRRECCTGLYCLVVCLEVACSHQHLQLDAAAVDVEEAQ